jgi:CubicO group peptidase (beta-lactamase class C family)
MRLSLRRLSLLGGALIVASYSQLELASADDWQSIAPADAGFAPNVGELLDQAVEQGDLPNLHAVVVARRGKLVLEHYYQGRDERWGQPLWIVTFGPEVKHDLRSISKSIVGLLYGIALDEGRVPSLDAPLVDQFPAYDDLRADPKRRRMTVAHALTMTLGTEWDESLPYSDPRNSEITMERAPDRYRFVLERPIVTEPGSRWNYNGGATAVLAHLIAKGSFRAASSRPWPARIPPCSSTSTELVHPNSTIDAAIWSTCASLCVRGLRWYGRSFSIVQSSIRSASATSPAL